VSFISEIKDLTAKHVIWYLIGFLATIAPGFLIIFYFRPQVIEKYDALKLVLLSSALTLPLLVVNASLVFTFIPESEDHDMNRGVGYFATLGGNAIILYVALALSYFGSLSFKYFLGIVFILELLLLLIGLIERRREKSKKTVLPIK